MTWDANGTWQMTAHFQLSLTDGCVQELQALGEAVGTVSRGVSQDIIDALPNANYTSRFSDEKPSNGACSPAHI